MTASPISGPTPGDYLVAVHVEGPADAAGFDPLFSPLMRRFLDRHTVSSCSPNSSSCRAGHSGWARRSSIRKRRRHTPSTVAAFAIERHPVTNAQFAEFVDATGYRHRRRAGAGSSAVSGCGGSRIWRRARWCSGRRPDRSICATGGSGGTGRPGHAGGIRSARTATSLSGSTIRWCRSPIPTRLPTRGGPAAGCPRRPSGSTRRAAARRRPMRGATTRCPAVG